MSPVLLPDPNRRLSQGVLVEAHVRARVLGIPLLKIEAFVALIPAAVARLQRLADVRTRASARPLASRIAPGKAPGSGLAEAIRSLEEAGDMLAAARRDCSSDPYR
jgi:hypothetical protein